MWVIIFFVFMEKNYALIFTQKITSDRVPITHVNLNKTVNWILEEGVVDRRYEHTEIGSEYGARKGVSLLRLYGLNKGPSAPSDCVDLAVNFITICTCWPYPAKTESLNARKAEITPPRWEYKTKKKKNLDGKVGHCMAGQWYPESTVTCLANLVMLF